MDRHYSQRLFLADDPLPKDEIDDLFDQLQLIEPPPSLIQQILTTVSRLSRFKSSPDPRDEADENIDSLVVRNENLPPS
jgi:hypothetical protein